nr:hypothetical protein [Tanacetum cinerariifolium]
HSRDYCTQIMDYCQSREVHTSTLVTQRDVSTLQRQHIDDEDRLTMHIQHEHAQRDIAPEDGDSYSRRFQELALMCDRTFPEESDRVKKYIGRVPDTIHDSVKATKPKTMHEAIEFATELMDKRIRDAVENKRKFEGTSGNNQNQPQQNKRQNTGRAYAAGNSDINMYTGPKPLCFKCDYHHEGPCPPRYNNCKRVGHLTRDCRSRPANANNNNNTNTNRNNNNNTNNNNNNQKGNGCYECGAQGHFKRNCPKLRNNNRDNQGRNDNAQAKVYVIRNAGENPDNVVAGMDWLSKCDAVIACAEKLVRIPFGNEILTIREEG